jgi:hypothetical protein
MIYSNLNSSLNFLGTETKTGDKFNITYYDVVLKYWPLLLDVFEGIINRWIEEQKKKA